MDDLLFVYGSLKRGFCHNYKIQDGFFVCNAKTHPFYRMYALGKFPALVKEADGVAIEGELWNIKKKIFRELDKFEGVSVDLYRREIIFLAEPRVFAHTYFFCRTTRNLLDCGTVWNAY